MFHYFLDFAYRIVWGPPLLIMLIGIGVYFTIALRGLQLRMLPRALRLAFGKQERSEHGDLTHFQSLMTALAATLGIGNLSGVATALMAGGVGALFWMWVMALLGMIVKYAEAILAVKYRIIDARGEQAGGPMYSIERGLGWKWLAVLFAAFTLLASLGGGNILQANTVADALASEFGIAPLSTGIAMAGLIALAIFGGIHSIGRVASLLVPLMTGFYLLGGAMILAQHLPEIPGALWSIVSHALTPSAAFGGFIGATLADSIRVGLSRGLMTSEAGLGTAAIASAAAKTECPAKQALVSMSGGFLATGLMCTVTALVLIVTGAYGSLDSNGLPLNGAAMTLNAFERALPWGSQGVVVTIALFGFTTVLAYAYYAEKCLEYLVGERGIPFYRALFVCMVVIGSVTELEIVWKFSDIANGLMAYPNLIGLIALRRVVVDETKRLLPETSDQVD
ncbi:MAG: sodium:alanine symporter family protein [Chlamydiia bacterium]|nr:sodium:alanine symporter family protein [Chlamydiia bacterium]